MLTAVDDKGSPRMNSTRTPDSLLPLQRLYELESKHRDQLAFVQPLGGGRQLELTWGQAVDQARRVAAHLQAQGVQAGDRVAILSKNTAHWLISDYAIWMAGGVSVPLYPTLAHTTVRQILEHSGAKLLFVGKLDDWASMKPGVPAGMPCVAHPLADADARASAKGWEDVLSQTEPMQGQPVRPADDLSTIMYTSGTTGAPKGVMHSFEAFTTAVQAGLKRVPLAAPNARMLSYLPLSHVVERVLVEHGQLATGMRVYFAESLDTFTKDLQRASPTVFFSVPRLWVKFQQGVGAKMPPAKLRLLLRIPIVSSLVKQKILTALGLQDCVFSAGGAAPMPQELLRWFSALGLRVAEGYGMTENLGASHITDGDPSRFGTVGPVLDHVQCRIAPDTGEIQTRAPWNMLGYYREPELTRQAFTDDGWLRTGDKGAIDAHGNLRITGRVKDLFKTSKGKYVAPAPIEDRLAANPAVEACCVTGANLGQPLALLMLNAQAMSQAATPHGRAYLEATLEATRSEVNAALDPHEQLDCLVITREAWSVENDLITPTFKVKRNRVEDRFADRYEAWIAKRQPVIWAD